VCWGPHYTATDTQYNTSQTAVSTIHMPMNDYLVPLVTCTLTDAIFCHYNMLICCTIIVIIIAFWDFLWSLLCYTLVSVLVLGIGIARGQYYWVLDIGSLSWYRSNPSNKWISWISLFRQTGVFHQWCILKECRG